MTGTLSGFCRAQMGQYEILRSRPSLGLSGLLQ